MNRRTFLKSGIACILGCAHLQNCAKKTSKPNIVLIFIDDMGYGDSSCYGNDKVQTFNIDRLAEMGIRLTQFYVNSPVCSPSRVALTTGQYPQRWNIRSYIASRESNRERNMADYLPPSAPTLARALRNAGYTTGHFGKWHMGGGRDVDDAPLPKAYGFDESFVSFEGLGDRVLQKNHRLSEQSAALGHGKITWAKKHEKTALVVDKALSFIKQHKNRPLLLRILKVDELSKKLEIWVASFLIK